MKRTQLLTIAFTLLVAVPASVHSQESNSELAISFGGALPTGDMDDGFAGGPSVGFEWTTSSGTNIAYGVGGHFNYYGIDQALKNIAPGVDFSAYGLDAVGLVKLHLGDIQSRTKPYFKGQAGIGTLTLKGSSGMLSASDTQTKATFAGGFGVTFRGQGNTGGHIELLYNALLTDGATATYVTLRGGITMFVGG